MIWLYRLLFFPGLLIALPYYALRMWRRGGYGKSFPHRLGAFPQLESPAPGKRRIWLQAVSVGEVLAVGPLIDALQSDGRIEIVLTTTTSTGYAEARKRYTGRVHRVGLFPLDFWAFSRKAWQRIQPDAVLLTESELWPEHLHRAARSGRPAFLVNARISDRSYRRYLKLTPLSRRLLRKFSGIYAASALDADRLTQLGAPTARVHSTGSIKFDVAIPQRSKGEAYRALRASLGFGETDAFILLGASTWPGEEVALLKAQQAARAAGIDCRLLLVPRHAERAPEIAALLSAQPLTWHRRSSGADAPAGTDIHLADTTGELCQLTQVADLAFIGKSLPPNSGGQTPIEAAGLGIPLLMGPQMQNFKEIAKGLLAIGAARSIATPEALSAEVVRLAQDGALRQTMHEFALEWHQANRGSSRRIAEAILDHLCGRKNDEL